MIRPIIEKLSEDDIRTILRTIGIVPTDNKEDMVSQFIIATYGGCPFPSREWGGHPGRRTLARYAVAEHYMNNQTEEGWRRLVREVNEQVLHELRADSKMTETST